MQLLKARIACGSLLPYHPPSGKLYSHTLSRVYPPQLAGRHRSEAQALGLRAGQTVGASHLLEPPAGLAKVGLQEVHHTSSVLVTSHQKDSHHQKNLTGCPVALSLCCPQGLPRGHAACLLPPILQRSLCSLSLVDAFCTRCSEAELAGGKRR